DPLWPEKATVGGVLSSNDSGALRLRFGALRDLIIGVTIALADGTLASSGGKVVKNVAGYDLPKLVTGALGTLGVITRAVFRLHPLPRHSRSFTISVSNPREAQQIILAIQDSKLAHVALQSQFSAEALPVIDILFVGTEAALASQLETPSVCNGSRLAARGRPCRQFAPRADDTACGARENGRLSRRASSSGEHAGFRRLGLPRRFPASPESRQDPPRPLEHA